MSPHEHFDVVIVGAGPAGLSAALILGRCCRKVLLCDRGTPRSWASKSMHGFIAHDGIPPAEFSDVASKELHRYPCVSFAPVEVTHAKPEKRGFAVTAGDSTVHTRKLLIATGLVDDLPQIEGFKALFGSSVFQCPYCDGWEYRNRPVAVYGQRHRGFEMARALTAWSRDIVLCTDGPAYMTADQRHQLAANDIQVSERRIRRLQHDGTRLSHIVFDDGTHLSREAIFFDLPSHAQSSLAAQLGCTFTHEGGVLCNKHEATNVPGVYVAGNIIRNVQLSIVAAAEGATAAFGINLALTREDFEGRIGDRSAMTHSASH